ncbi:hypothetical protein DIPPA_33710 [Diplonema papillatum]|nr:hypothetical protein DIPPA_33710 [Diplonema papillatum]
MATDNAALKAAVKREHDKLTAEFDQNRKEYEDRIEVLTAQLEESDDNGLKKKVDALEDELSRAREAADREVNKLKANVRDLEKQLQEARAGGTDAEPTKEPMEPKELAREPRPKEEARQGSWEIAYKVIKKDVPTKSGELRPQMAALAEVYGNGDAIDLVVTPCMQINIKVKAHAPVDGEVEVVGSSSRPFTASQSREVTFLVPNVSTHPNTNKLSNGYLDLRWNQYSAEKVVKIAN